MYYFLLYAVACGSKSFTVTICYDYDGNRNIKVVNLLTDNKRSYYLKFKNTLNVSFRLKCTVSNNNNQQHNSAVRDEFWKGTIENVAIIVWNYSRPSDSDVP